MQLLDGLDAIPASLRGGVVTIGNFDGVHLGHAAILEAAARRAGQRPVVAVTFHPHPLKILSPETAPAPLCQYSQRLALLRERDLAAVAVLRSTPALLATEPEAFISEMIAAQLKPCELVEGPNFRFGRGRRGDVSLLEKLGPENGFAVRVADVVHVRVGEQLHIISSSLIRQLVVQGSIADAAICLNRPYTLRGKVATGQGRGGHLSFPTANLDVGGQLIPGEGVYAGRAQLDGTWHLAAISIGTKSTFGEHQLAVEAFLLDFEADIYGKLMDLAFLEYLRPQQRFETPEKLKAQIAEDVCRVRQRASI